MVCKRISQRLERLTHCFRHFFHCPLGVWWCTTKPLPKPSERLWIENTTRDKFGVEKHAARCGGCCSYSYSFFSYQSLRPTSKHRFLVGAGKRMQTSPNKSFPAHKLITCVCDIMTKWKILCSPLVSLPRSVNL